MLREDDETAGSRTQRVSVALLGSLLALASAAPSIAAGPTPWVLEDPRGDLRLPLGGSGAGIAQDAADLLSLTLARGPEGVTAWIDVASLAQPFPETPPPAEQQVRYVLRFSTPSWSTVIVDVTLRPEGVSPAAVFATDGSGTAVWFDAPVQVVGPALRVDLAGVTFDGTWTGIWIEAIAEVCSTYCVNAGYGDRAPNAGTAKDFP